MEIPLNAQVECTDGVCGRSVYILINPVQKEVSHLVVKENTDPYQEYLVPVDKVAEMVADTIQLTCRKSELRGMEPFRVTRFIKEVVPGRYYSDAGAFGAGTLFYLPYNSSEVTWTSEVKDKQIPPGELPVYRGTIVEASDGPVGKVDEFIVNPENCHITHLVMREGHLWGKKDVVIPITAIDKTYEDVVYLNLNKKQIAALPAIPVHRLWD
jgi:hypothetical protein